MGTELGYPDGAALGLVNSGVGVTVGMGVGIPM